MAHDRHESSRAAGATSLLMRSGMLLGLYGAFVVVLVIFSVAWSEPSFLCVAAGVAAAAVFMSLTPTTRRALDAAERGDMEAKVDFIILSRRRLALASFTIIMIVGAFLTNLFPETQLAVVVTTFMVGGATALWLRFRNF